MANATDKAARSVHGTNPQNLLENILRQKIYDLPYWKNECFALTAETLIERAVELRCVGGTFGGTRKASRFMCLVLKLLQIQPEVEIVLEYIRNEEFKYLRLLGAFYLRLTGRPAEVYQYLEPLYNDYRRIRVVNPDGSYSLDHVDAAVHMLLTKPYAFDVALPRLPGRPALEAGGFLEPWQSPMLEDYLEVSERRRAERAAARAAAAEAGAAEGGGGDGDGEAVRYLPSAMDRQNPALAVAPAGSDKKRRGGEAPHGRVGGESKRRRAGDATGGGGGGGGGGCRRGPRNCRGQRAASQAGPEAAAEVKASRSEIWRRIPAPREELCLIC